MYIVQHEDGVHPFQTLLVYSLHDYLHYTQKNTDVDLTFNNIVESVVVKFTNFVFELTIDYTV